MRRRRNTAGIVVTVLTAVFAVAIAAIVKDTVLKDSRWAGVIFWGIIILVGGAGGILAGRFLGR